MNRSTLVKMSIEVASIVLGVLLALAVNEWDTQRKNAAEANAALVNVLQEIRDNAATLDLIHDNNAAALERLVATSDDEIDEADLTFIPAAQLQDGAWATLVATGVGNHLEYEIVLLLSDLYATQDVLKETWSMITESAMTASAVAAGNGRALDNGDFARAFQDHFTVVVGVEAQIRFVYDNALATLGASSSPTPQQH